MEKLAIAYLSLLEIFRPCEGIMGQQISMTEIARICSSDEKVALSPGQFLFLEGDRGDALYVVKKGILRVMHGKTIYETLKTGSIVGEMAIVDGERRSASVIAGSHVELVRIDEAAFLGLVKSVPHFALMVMRVMATRLRTMNERFDRTTH